MSSRNLESLQAEFRNTGEAQRGYITLKSHFTDIEYLDNLLRNHRFGTVYADELRLRLEIDMLLKYYSLLLIGIFSGYIPKKLDETSKKEIIEVLSNRSVQRYYNVNYPDKIISYTYDFFRRNMDYGLYVNIDSNTIGAFNEFLGLCRYTASDEDIQIFQDMLDYVSVGRKNIITVSEILSSYTKLSETLSKNDNSATTRAIWGFVKYTAFLSQLKELFSNIENNPLLQSSMWMYYGYYFNRLSKTMSRYFEPAFANLQMAFSNEEILIGVAKELYGNDVQVEDYDYKAIKELSESAINEALSDVKYILNEKWKVPIELFFKK